MTAVCVGDHVTITDTGINFGSLVGVPATVVGIEDHGWWVVPDVGAPGRRAIRIDGRWIPMRIWVESVQRDHEADECRAVSPHGDVCARLKEHTGLCQSGVGRKHVSSPEKADKPWHWYRTAPAPSAPVAPSTPPGSTETGA